MHVAARLQSAGWQPKAHLMELLDHGVPMLGPRTRHCKRGQGQLSFVAGSSFVLLCTEREAAICSVPLHVPDHEHTMRLCHFALAGLGLRDIDAVPLSTNIAAKWFFIIVHPLGYRADKTSLPSWQPLQRAVVADTIRPKWCGCPLFSGPVVGTYLICTYLGA